ncbi:DNA methyltransferase [Klebsiella aerogenes]|uniref:DNA methyltransferase n=1 Tax=Klebsiella aerogenes TaxID=548 RepID=UPI00063C5E7A|nr:DNA methyltransferase [Klebsiella aerogenes]EKZ5445545.1 site-specific DNA-methyltransferase [Klebsiella aerogenes]EMB4653138.1 site-specific DNA-methyltransferase [Klebsiella aerogenes]KLE97225.1 DNA methylase [Klebsiella aerogenes]MDK7097533.1 DNA methyltransferase [Klebsiella aerogenes]MDK7643600.1 DNA methyltransferase [Klebsiella aerogenes]
MSKYNELVKKLKEIFQIDRPELDFGIYRILNARADEINDYLENKLKIKIQSALADAENANKAELEQQLYLAIKAATDAGFEPDKSPKVQEVKKKLSTITSGASEHENAVFTHLLTFFSRYYDNGDFISKRRYKGNTYAIPYAGEEVMLHWANKDQYYIKSGENFANYSFKLADGRKVSFKLLAADTAKDNRKDNDLDRCFVLIEPHVRTKFDDEGEEYEKEYKPVEVIKATSIVDGESVDTEELVIHFEYKAMKKGTKQDALVQVAISKILSDNIVQQHWADLAKRAPTENNPARTELERHLTTYTQRNTADYFIHKNLGGFLNNELDFYIKNEVMNLDNLQNADVFANVEKQLRMIQCLRSVAKELITFLAQIENFQKKIWNKKKFVVDTNYLFTIDKLPKNLYSAVIKNDAQWEQWYQLGFLHNDSVDREKTLKENAGLIVDTSLFERKFKDDFLLTINDIDECLSGNLYSGDNYQVLKLISTKYEKVIDGIYIDPPYNTNASEILYKNGYKDSSWCSLMNSRLEVSKSLLKENAATCTTIDEYEVANLELLLKETFVGYKIRPVIIEYNHRGRVKSNFAITHEYALWTIPEDRDVISRQIEISDEIRRNLRRTGSSSTRAESESQFYGIEVDNTTLEIVDVTEALPSLDTAIPAHLNKNTTMVWPIDDQGVERRWYYGRDRVIREAKEGTVWAKKIKGEIQIHYKQAGKPKMRKSVWVGPKLDASTYGSELLNSLFNVTQINFSFPKSIYAVKECLESLSNSKHAHFLDYFAGSGTTGHAVIDMNREDNGSRKFSLVEQGEYFYSVTLPRIKKAIYSTDWKYGKAIKSNPVKNTLIKHIKIESFEDALNNITLKRDEMKTDLFDSLDAKTQNDYLLKYMFESESKHSILSTDNFKKPFNYEMDIATDSAGATECKTIDLVETFNYLIGLHVKSIESNVERGYVRIEGTLPTGERTLILWRDCDKIGYEELNKYANRFDLYAKEKTFDVIYINGDHNLPTAFTVDEENGEIVRSLKIRQIEPEFLNLMFAEEA